MSPTPSQAQSASSSTQQQPQQSQQQHQQQQPLAQQQQQQQLQQQLIQQQLQQQQQQRLQQQHQHQQQQQQLLLQQQQQQIHRSLNQNIQHIKLDIHNLQESLKNPNLTPQVRQEKEGKLNYYSNLLRAPISISPMVGRTSMQSTSTQIMPMNTLSTLNSAGALSSQSVSPMVRTSMQSTSTQIMPMNTLSALNPTGALSSQSGFPSTSNTLTSMLGKESIASNNTYLPPGTSHIQIPNPENPERPIVAKRKIQELVEQIDPRERLEPEVEDLLLDIADEFITSVASFACRLAKHRKSDTLEVKDLQLHLERNWNIRIPGFASDEIRSVRKPVIAAAHQQKLAAVNSARQSSSH